jgi:hypothetical protein
MVDTIQSYPLSLFVLSVVVLWLSVQVGAVIGRKRPSLAEDERDDLDLVINASLTMLALIIGFTFSMAVSRYDQRKNYEEEEANAIGTEYVRADLLPADQGARVRQLLTQYLDLRLLFYTVRDSERLEQVNAQTARLQDEMWSAVKQAAQAQPTPVAALAVAGMNDVLNRQGYTQAAWWNRIPAGAWALMGSLGICCSVLIGYGAHHQRNRLFLVLPFLVSLAFCLIADIDSPRRGVIRVRPQNLISLSDSLHKP